jgi:hypothetical protein
MGNLGSFAVGFFTFILLTPIRVETYITSCVRGGGSRCSGGGRDCYTLLGWEDVLGPLSCSIWSAAGVGIVVGAIVRVLGIWRKRGTG